MRTLFTATLLFSVACTSSEPKQKLIRGSIDVKPEMKANVQPTDTVFVIARKAAGGPPLAVKKLAAASFPMPFELTEKDVMMGGPFEGDVDITVRIDKDGDAMTKNPG